MLNCSFTFPHTVAKFYEILNMNPSHQIQTSDAYKGSCFLVLLVEHIIVSWEKWELHFHVPRCSYLLHIWTADHITYFYIVHLYTEYFLLVSLQINVDHHIREKIKKSLEKPSLSCFNEAQKHVYLLMERDSCPRFLHSDAYLSVKHKSRSLWYI